MADDITIVVNAQDNFTGVLAGFGSIMTGIKSTIDMVAGAFEGAYDFINQFVNSASESQTALVGLETVLKSTGDTAGITISQLIGMSSALQDVTMFSDEEVQSAEAMLLRFENLNAIFPEALKLTTDYAASLGIDLTTAAQTVGKALDDPASGIGRLNMQFKLFNETEMETIKNMAANGDIAGAQALIMERLTEKVGGAAEAFGTTFAGQLAIAQNKIDDVKELIGGAFLPVLTELLNSVIQFANQPEVIQFFTDMANSISKIIDTVSSGTFNFGDFTQSISDSIKAIDWNQISNDLATGIQNIDWAKVGQTLSQVTMIILDVLKTVVSNIDWSALLQSFTVALGDFIAGVAGFSGWADMANEVTVVLKYEFNKAIGNWIYGIWDSVSVAWNYIKYNFSSMGYDIVNGLRAGLTGSWSEWWAAVSDFFNRFITNVKLVLGISSASTVFTQIAKDIVQGLINGFVSAWNTLMDIARNALDDFFSLFGIDLSDILGTGSGSTGGGSTGGTTGGGTGTGGTGGTSGTGQTVNNYFYGPVYIGSSLDDANYDCPSPNPLVASSGNQLVATGY